MLLVMARLATVFSVAFLVSCDEFGERPTFTDVPKERSSLVDGLYSYLSPSEASELLGELATSWKVLEDEKAPPGDSRPPFRLYTTLVHGFENLGFEGDLKLTFFNERLMSAGFFPNDPVAYFQRLNAVLPALTEKTPARVPPFTDVVLGIDYQSRKFASWEDTRLVREMAFWIKRYS
jgi:hypothetical protein